MVMIRPGTIFILRRLSNHSTVQRKRNKNMNPDFLFVCPPLITMQDVGTGFYDFIYIETTIRYTAEIGNTCLLFYENTTLVSVTIRYEWLLRNIHYRDGNEIDTKRGHDDSTSAVRMFIRYIVPGKCLIECRGFHMKWIAVYIFCWVLCYWVEFHPQSCIVFIVEHST